MINCLNFCGDWDQYKGSKCIKILKKKETAERALNECLKLDNSSSLITIRDNEEQEFINKLLKKYTNISMFAWIGRKYNGKEYKWVDGMDSEFDNWSDEAVKEGEEPCAKMSLMKGMFGKWIDSTCKRRALIVCQRRPELSLSSLKDIIQNMSDIIERQQNSLEVTEKINNEQQAQINSMIPLGFVYTQLPNQSAPQEIWPNMNWTEVTDEYSGLFFRAEGGTSLPFGQIQHANQSWISNQYIQEFNSRYSSTSYSPAANHPAHYEGWTYMAYQGYGLRQFGWYTTEGDVRPRNTAVKIWKRVA